MKPKTWLRELFLMKLMIKTIDKLADKVDAWLNFLSGGWIDYLLTKSYFKYSSYFALDGRLRFIFTVLQFCILIFMAPIVILLLGTLFVLCGIISFYEMLANCKINR